MGFFRFGRGDSQPCSQMCCSVMPRMRVPSCLQTTMVTPWRTWMRRTAGIMYSDESGFKAASTLERGLISWCTYTK